MATKKVYKTLSCADLVEFTNALAIITAREDVLSISFNGNIGKQGDVRGAESRFNISWEEPEIF